MSGNVLLVSPLRAADLTPLREVLREDGYTLQTAADTETALQKARHEPPVAVILDADIQTDTDLLLLQWLRTDPTTVAVKLLVTADSSEQRLAALEAGADEFLTAPLDWVEVRARLRSMQAGQSRRPSLEDFLSYTPDLVLGANPVDILGNADLLSHDLKSPVGIVSSSLELLLELTRERSEENPSAARDQRLVENALQASRRLLFLIDDMIDLAKLEADAFPVTLEPLDMPALVRQVVTLNAAAIEARGITATVEAPPALPLASGDRTLVKRICNALLDNSLKFSGSDDRITWILTASDTHVAVTATDHGRPILPQYRDSIFERAVQWEARELGGRTSVAMGLPFARTAARRLNGDLTVSSRPADGTTSFSLYLPLASQPTTS